MSDKKFHPDQPSTSIKDTPGIQKCLGPEFTFHQGRIYKDGAPVVPGCFAELQVQTEEGGVLKVFGVHSEGGRMSHICDLRGDAHHVILDTDLVKHSETPGITNQSVAQTGN